MKQSKIIIAYNALPSLSNVKGFSKYEQWDLYKLRNLLKPHYDFQVEQETMIKNKYAEFADDDGNISGEYAKSYLKELNELNDMNVELEEFNKPRIQMKDDITLTLIDALDDFIEFTAPD